MKVHIYSSSYVPIGKVGQNMTCDEKGGGKMLDGLSIKWEDTLKAKGIWAPFSHLVIYK